MALGYEFTAAGGGEYTLIPSDGSFVIDAGRVRWQGDDLVGEITVQYGEVPVGPLAFVFNRASSRKEVLGLVGDSWEAAADALNAFCSRVVKAERRGSSPIVRLRDVPRPTAEREYVLPFLPSLPRSSMAIWFGDGGTGKSLLALYACGQLAQQGLRVLYLDWEWDADEHRLRYERLFGQATPEAVDYWRCEQPLAQISDAVAGEVRKRKIDYVVVDSIAYACGGNAESSEVAAQYKLHTGRFGVGSLHLAHVTKTGNTEKPFGSAFWHNSARSTWYIAATELRENGTLTETDLEFWHRKSNLGPTERRPRLIRFTADSEREIVRVVSGAANEPAGEMSSPDRIKQALASAPRSRDDLKQILADINGETLKRAISRGLKAGWLAEDDNDVLSLVNQPAQRPRLATAA